MCTSRLVNRFTLLGMSVALAGAAWAADKPSMQQDTGEHPATAGAMQQDTGEHPATAGAMQQETTAQPAAAGATQHDAELIASAMRAAPVNVGKYATVVAMDATGHSRTLRQGSNGFTCMPDNPATPGPDPMCMDASAMEWVNAWVAHQAPTTGKIGFIYMLEGGTDASNTDPYATKPDEGNHWVKTGPHVMIVGADAGFYDAYPKKADPDTTQPYVMWAGTPYQHLMLPIH